MTPAELAAYRQGLTDAIPLTCRDCKRGHEPERVEGLFLKGDVDWIHRNLSGESSWQWCIASGIRELLREESSGAGTSEADV